MKQCLNSRTGHKHDPIYQSYILRQNMSMMQQLQGKNIHQISMLWCPQHSLTSNNPNLWILVPRMLSRSLTSSSWLPASLVFPPGSLVFSVSRSSLSLSPSSARHCYKGHGWKLKSRKEKFKLNQIHVVKIQEKLRIYYKISRLLHNEFLSHL